MVSNRLELRDKSLAGTLRNAKPANLRAIATACARFALERTNLVDPIIEDGLKALEAGAYGDSPTRREVDSLVNKLDKVAWKTQEAQEQGRADREAYESAFNRARAAHALYFSLDKDPLIAAAESAYEAESATRDLTGLRSIILSKLGSAEP